MTDWLTVRQMWPREKQSGRNQQCQKRGGGMGRSKSARHALIWHFWQVLLCAHTFDGCTRQEGTGRPSCTVRHSDYSASLGHENCSLGLVWTSLALFKVWQANMTTRRARAPKGLLDTNGYFKTHLVKGKQKIISNGDTVAKWVKWQAGKLLSGKLLHHVIMTYHS